MACEVDNELLLFDRLNVIKDTVNKYGEDKFYIAFSGGRQCENLWKPVYQEYRRIGFRLKNEEQIKLF